MKEIETAYDYKDNWLEIATNIKSSEYTPKIKNRKELESKIEFVGRWFDISPKYLKGDDDKRTTFTSYILNLGKQE